MFWTFYCLLSNWHLFSRFRLFKGIEFLYICDHIRNPFLSVIFSCYFPNSLLVVFLLDSIRLRKLIYPLGSHNCFGLFCLVTWFHIRWHIRRFYLLLYYSHWFYFLLSLNPLLFLFFNRGNILVVTFLWY